MSRDELIAGLIRELPTSLISYTRRPTSHGTGSLSARRCGGDIRDPHRGSRSINHPGDGRSPGTGRRARAVGYWGASTPRAPPCRISPEPARPRPTQLHLGTSRRRAKPKICFILATIAAALFSTRRNQHLRGFGRISEPHVFSDSRCGTAYSAQSRFSSTSSSGAGA